MAPQGLPIDCVARISRNQGVGYLGLLARVSRPHHAATRARPSKVSTNLTIANAVSYPIPDLLASFVILCRGKPRSDLRIRTHQADDMRAHRMADRPRPNPDGTRSERRETLTHREPASERISKELIEADFESAFSLVDMVHELTEEGDLASAAGALHDADDVVLDIERRLRLLKSSDQQSFDPLIGELRRAIALAKSRVA